VDYSDLEMHYAPDHRSSTGFVVDVAFNSCYSTYSNVPLPCGLAGGISFYWLDSGGTAIRDQKARVNRRIRVPWVRLIDEDGKQIGIVSTQEALMMAENRGLDLVEVAPNADPPVCRLMDYGKYLYEQNKREREARKKQKVVEVKEVRMQPNTDSHDIEVKSNQARRFLQEGDKVKFTIRFRGRQFAHQDIGIRMLEDVAEKLRDVAVVEVQPQTEGRRLIMVVAPQPANKPRSAKTGATVSEQPVEQT
jgi:translation initiation factor IF-3